jgi:hypothetical protein
MQFSTYRRMPKSSILELPLRVHGGKLPTGLPDDALDAAGYADLEGVLLARGRAAIAEFRAYRSRALGEPEEGSPDTAD